MRNLKKILALVLALMMVLSVMVTTSAADETDAIVYQEAADLTQALKIVDGTDNGYDPNGLFTREQAATLLARVTMGRTAANALVTAGDPFTDVKATHWGAGAIAWAADEGYIVGTGDGSFNPTGILDGYGWLKLLLCAIGYGDPTDYTGSNWKLATINAAKAAGLLATMPAGYNYGDQITRDYAMELAFTAMKAGTTTVTYGVYLVADVTNHVAAANATAIATYGDMLSAVQLAASLGNAYDWGTKTTKHNLLTDVHKASTEDYVDHQGRPGYTWNVGGKALSTVMTAPANSWENEKIKQSDVWAELISNTTTTSMNIEIWVNGKCAGTATFNKGAKTEIAASGKGTHIEAYKNITVDGATEYALVVVQEFVGVAGEFVPANAQTKAPAYVPVVVNNKTYKYYGETELAEKDLVLVTLAIKPAAGQVPAETYVDTAAVLTPVTGAATMLDANGYVTVADQTYTSSLKSADYTTLFRTAITTKDHPGVELYLDSFGNIIFAKAVGTEVVETFNYGVVIDLAVKPVVVEGELFGNQGANYNEYWAQILNTKGEVDTVKYYEGNSDADFVSIMGTITDGNKTGLGNLINYNPDPESETGVYTVEDVSGEDIVNAALKAAAGTGDSATPSGLVQGKPGIITGTNTTTKTSSNTVFVVQDKAVPNKAATYSVYTGFAKVPTLADATNVYAIVNEDGFATYVFALGTTYPVVNQVSEDVIYLNDATGVYTLDATGEYYTCVALVKGEVKTITVTKELFDKVTAAGGIAEIAEYTVNKSGHIAYVANTTTVTGKTYTNVLTVDAENGIYTLAGDHAYDAEIVVYVDNGEDGIAVLTMADYAASAYNDKEAYTVKAYTKTVNTVTVVHAYAEPVEE